MKYLVNILIFLFIIPIVLTAKSKHYNNWVFMNCRVNFNKTPPKFSTNPHLLNYEGTSTFSDPITGKLILYTNGVSVYDKNHHLIKTKLGGHPSSSDAGIIVPVFGEKIAIGF